MVMPGPPDSCDGYAELRKRVQDLKTQHHQAVQQQHVHREVDVASLASRCSQLEALNLALTVDNEKQRLQQQQNIERAAKLRKHHEREIHKLKEQVETLSQATSSIEEGWASKLAAAESTAAVRVQHLEAEAARLKQQQEAGVAQMVQEHEAKLQDVDEWCRGEIEAVQHNARAQVAQAHEAVEHWQLKYDAVSVAHQELLDVHEAQTRELDELQAALQERDGELQAANAALLRLHKQHADAHTRAEEEQIHTAQCHAGEMEALRAQQAEQLAHIDSRLQGVLSKKDATIAALRAELQRVVTRTAKVEEVEVATNGVEPVVSNGHSSSSMLEFDELADIIRLVHDTDIVEFELKSKRFSLSVRKKEAIQAEQAAAYQAEVGGEVVKFLVENGQPISVGQPIMIIKP
ncbi:hypothetical protein TSOC_008031 [Tetrabaena socialis]|uniref:Uncharacterized protein n=1 Tax=Tetrabaena socialis TaxID=47790 RepID=A0A2J7ZZI1_9CHLO|nr:hypothetical protein TSOC_008031 [Tetrabaena socialis]|eukprot:PNH05680.1 hypothetical protein TSOC_008031 [Tetrabaena socialis]